MGLLVAISIAVGQETCRGKWQSVANDFDPAKCRDRFPLIEHGAQSSTIRKRPHENYEVDAEVEVSR